MEQYKKDFIDLLVQTKALRFGHFTLKSGRACPYFLNMGQFYEARAFVALSDAYAQCVKKHVESFDTFFGPAYKGIPLAVGVASAFYQRYEQNVSYTYNRKEAKDHGEGGMLVGAPITEDSKVVIVDDVMTAGTAVRESLTLLGHSGDPQVVGIVLACDRMEKGQSDKSAVQELKEEFDIDVYSIVNLAEIVEHLQGREVDGEKILTDEHLEAIEAYRKEYGV